MSRSKIFNKIAVAVIGLLVFIVGSWTLYVLAGHSILAAMYRSKGVRAVDLLMSGKDVLRLEDYFYLADRFMLLGTVWAVISVATLLTLIRNFRGVATAGVSLLVVSFTLFALFEAFPSLIRPLNLMTIPYYAYMSRYVPDDRLAFTERPNLHETFTNFRGAAHSPLYDYAPTARTISFQTDDDGFRNSRSKSRSDVIILGDSFTESGDDESDTFGQRLERHLQLTVTTLGKAGYNPFQYLEVLNRYGLTKQPRYAVLCVYEGNDLREMERYLEWRRGNGSYSFVYSFGSLSFLQRYAVVLTETGAMLKDSTWTLLQLASKNLLSTQYTYPEEVVLRLGPNIHRTVFVDHVSEPEDVAPEVWLELRDIFMEFKQITAVHGIVPIIINIPTSTRVYAEYSTDESGATWREIRKGQIALARQASQANRLRLLSEELGLNFIDFGSIFASAARDHRMLYDAYDSHWNAEGREIAAATLANILKNRHISGF